MAKLEIVNSLTRSVHRLCFKLKKYSPELLVGAGVAGVVASTIMACKATTKLDEILKEPKEKIDKIHEFMEKPEMIPEVKEYTIEYGKKDLRTIYTQSAISIFKLYAPAFAVGSLSITAIISGHNILRKRNIAIAAAYTAIDKGFKDYRNRVVEQFGEELDKELRYNIKSEEIEETIVNEDGSETIVKKTVDVVNSDDAYSIYAKVYDDGCNGWTKDPEYNMMFLKDQQRYANDLLKSRGHLFLNEVYDLLGINRTKAGNVVGWIYDEKNPVGDNFVDFGIYDIYDERKRDFINGYERNIILDFNVDGEILNMI